jgi:hypothetical protein
MPKTKTLRYLTAFFNEKAIDRDETFDVDSKNGTPNVMSYGVVIDTIKGAPINEQRGIADMLRKIDFRNGDVKDYLRHLAKALAVDL